MQKTIKFQSTVCCKCNDNIYSFKSNELEIQLNGEPVARKSIPYMPQISKCCERKNNCLNLPLILFILIYQC